MKKIIIGNDKIQVGDFIIDVEKIGVSINGESLGVVVKCKQLLNDDDLIWESLDGKSSACDSIYQFKKVINYNTTNNNNNNKCERNNKNNIINY